MRPVNEITEAIIGAAIEVHRTLGPGLLEASYEAALCIELEERGMRYLRQLPIPLTYKGRPIGEYRLDLLVEDAVIIEVKSVDRFDPVFSAQLLTYLRATSIDVGLLINFNSQFLKDGIRRYVL
jgi:GxxExxY protein